MKAAFFWRRIAESGAGEAGSGGGKDRSGGEPSLFQVPSHHARGDGDVEKKSMEDQ